MKARTLLKRLKGWNSPAKEVPKNKLPASMRQEGVGCDCRGCDKD